MKFPVLLVLSAILIAQLAAAQSFVELGVTSFNNGDLKQAEQRFIGQLKLMTQILSIAEIERF